MLTETQMEKLRRDIGNENGRLPAIFAALSDRGRFRIFTILLKHKEVCVSDIANVLGITVSAASQQLKILEMSGLAKRERMGQMICYEVRKEDPVVKSIIKVLAQGRHH